MSWRVAVGGFQHETNTFAPAPTPMADFESGGAWPALTRAPELIERFKAFNLPLSGFLHAAEGFELVPLIWAGAEPSGTVTADAFDRISGLFLDGLREAGEIDAIYLDLHGAMVPEGYEDGEAELLRRIRELVGPDLPIAVSLDLHGNMSRAFFERASVVTIYRTYPHIDMAETGARAAARLRRLLEQGAPFASAWRQLDYIIPITAQSTMREPGGRLYRMLPELETDGVASVDLAFGFPPADISDCGCSVFAYGTDQAAVDKAADAVIAALEAAESAFVDPMIPADQAARRAMAIAESAMRPVVIADPQDNPGAGAPGDSTGLLKALIDADAEACLSMFWDPATAAKAHEAGIGAEFEARLGGSDVATGGPPLACRVRVEALSDGAILLTGAMFNGVTAQFGPMARLRILDGAGAVEVILASERGQNFDLGCFRALGVEPTERKILAVKSATHFMAAYAPIAEEILFAEAPGANPCRIASIPYTKLRAGVRLGAGGPAFSPKETS